MRAAAVLTTLIAAGPPALAAPPAAPEGVPAPAAVELARMVLPRSNWDQVLAATRDQMRLMTAQPMEDLVRKRAGEIPADFPRFMEEQMESLMAGIFPTYEEMLDFQAGLVQKHYTATELQELLAFYRTPLGQKAIRIQPEVARDVMGWMQALVQQKIPAAVEKMTARFQAYAEEHGAPAKDASPAKKDGPPAKKGRGTR